MNMATVGAARVVFGADTTEFDSAARGVEGVLGRLQDAFRAIETHVRNVGVGMTVALTVPLGLLGRSAKSAGADFEASMNGVRAALNGLRPDQLKALAEQARTLGPQVGKTAVEAADGIAALGLSGMRTSTILKGGLASSLKLAAANNADVAAAGALANDVMSQFRLTGEQLPGVVDKVTGALDAGKYGFNDYRLAASQAGGVAGSLGVTFDDFNVTIAALSSRFASGSDAGTAYAAMIRAIVNPSDDAVKAMAALTKQTGFSGDIFKDAQGNIRPLIEIVENLEKTVGRAGEGDRGKALAKLVGGDGMRAALALLEQGRAGVIALREQVAATNADKKISILQEGDISAAKSLAAAFDNLKIAIANAGLLQISTAIKQAMTQVVTAVASVPPIFLKLVVVAGVVTAALGPLLLAGFAVGKALLLLRIGSIGPLMLAVSALINPIGTLTALLVRFGATALGINLVGTALGGLLRFAGPIGLVATAIGLMVSFLNESVVASKDATDASNVLTDSVSDYVEAAGLAAAATGKERDEALKNAAAKREQARQNINAARAQLAQARATLVQAQAEQARAIQVQENISAGGGELGGAGIVALFKGRAAERAKVDVAALNKAIGENLKSIGQADRVINAAANSPAGGDLRLNFDDPAKAKKAKKDNSEDLAARREELRLQAELEAARGRGDVDAAKRLADQIELTAQVRAYRDTELPLLDAQREAARDIALLRDARQKAAEREQAADTDAIEIEWASVTANHALEQSLRDQEELHRRIETYSERWGDRQKAQLLAEEDMNRLLEARAVAQKRLIEGEARDRAIELAKLRGDSEASIRALERAAQIQERARAIERDRNLNFGEGVGQATAEALEEDKARLTGTFRDTIKSGFRAALDGDLGGFVKNWWKDRVAKGLEEALNSLSDLIARLFSKAVDGGASGGAGGGGLFGAIGGIFGSIFGRGSADWNGTGGIGGSDIVAGDNLLNKILNPASSIPGFKTGGSFKVGGMSGIDRNLVQFRATAGERVDITPANDRGASGGRTVVFDARGAVLTSQLLDQFERIANDTGGQMIAKYDQQQRRSAARAIPG